MKGIYKIQNKLNGKYYLGSTKNFHVRKLKHLNELRKNTYHCIHLQRAWNKYGEEFFDFVLIEECENYQELEQECLNTLDFKLLYNVSKSASGGNLIHNHPNKDEILKKSIEVLLNAPKPQPRFGENNPNWKGGISKSYCDCGKEKALTAKTCSKCQDKSGINNPFYGRKHSEETKRKLSELRKGNKNLVQRKIVIIENIEYESVSIAAKELNVSQATIIYRIKSPNPKYKNYNYK